MTRKRASRDMFDDEPAGGFLAGVGELIAAHPSIAGGSAAFAVIFGFVSANALWYQPGKHPAPILSTREAQAAVPAPVSDAGDAIREAIEAVPVRRVTTYRIERGDDDTATGSIPVPNIETVIGGEADAADATGETKPAGDPLLAEIQAQLKHKGFYGGEVDGLMGPMSTNAIRNWQKKAGLEPTGLPSETVLESLKRGGRLEPIVPRPETRPETPAAPAAKVAKADRKPTPPVTVPASAPAPAAQPAPAGSDLVRRIQSGLSNIAYADIAVDGLIGEETKNAISAFEKHYRLPVTGEPNERVLKKLIEIGAL
jgi:Putative peptidoglycan-binding domain-containing protein